MKRNDVMRLVSCGVMAFLSLAVSSAQARAPGAENTQPKSSEPSMAPASVVLAEMPLPAAPKVSCDQFQLTISAENSTLWSVLAAVRSCTGIKIDLPEGTVGGRTFGVLGPGPAKDVLASLLTGSGFNYVIDSSSDDPPRVESVVLLSRTKDAHAVDVPLDRQMTPQRLGWAQSRQNYLNSRIGASLPTEGDSANDAAAAPAAGNTNAALSDVPSAHAPEDAGADTSASSASPIDKMASPASTALPASSGDIPNSNGSSSGTSGKISDMMQLFEERKKMNKVPNSSTTTP